MAATPPGTVIDVVVLVLSRSELKKVVGGDALKAVLTGSQRTLFPDPQTLSLQAVWDLLESQPGFTAEAATPPMCRLKTWEGPLKVKVTMPHTLDHLDGPTREKRAMLVNVGDDDLLKIVRTSQTRTGQNTPLPRVIESGTVKARKDTPKRGIPPKVAYGLAAVGVLAAAISIYLTLGRTTGSTVKISASELTTEIPIANVRRSGALMVATHTDPAAWARRSQEDQIKVLEGMGPKVRAQNATGLLLLDPQGVLLATLRLDQTPQVQFPIPKRR